MENEDIKTPKKKGGRGCLVISIILFITVFMILCSGKSTLVKSLENTTFRISGGNNNWVIHFTDEYFNGYPEFKYSCGGYNAYLGETTERGSGYILSIDKDSQIIHCRIVNGGEYWVPKVDDYISYDFKYRVKDGKIVSLSFD